MVEENFKIGLDFEVNDASLSTIESVVEKAIKNAIAAGTAGRGAAPPTRQMRQQAAAAVPTVATARSMKDALKIDSNDIAKAILNAMDTATKPVVESNKTLAAAITKLVDALQKNTAVTAAAPAATVAAASVRAAAPAAAPKQPTSPPSAPPSARGGRLLSPEDMVRDAQRTVASVNKSLEMLESSVTKLFPNLQPQKLLRQLGLGGRAELGPGASVVMKDAAGQLRLIGREITIVNGKLEKSVDAVSATVEHLLSITDVGKGRQGTVLEGALGGPRYRGEAFAVAKARGELKGMMDKLPVLKEGRTGLGMAKGGEANLRFVPTKEQSERLSKLREEKDVIIEVNKMLYELAGGLENLAEVGIEVFSILGRAEGEAVDRKKMSVVRDPDTRAVTQVDIPINVRDLAAYGLLEAGGVKQTRMVQPHSVAEMVGGQSPRVMGGMERSRMEAGIISPQQGRELTTAVVDIPEVMEDQILILKRVADEMQTLESRSVVVRELAKGLTVGMEVTEKNLKVGLSGLGEDVVFDKKGITALIKSIEPIMEDGIEGYLVEFEELKKVVTGSKVSTRGGNKGIVRVEDSLGTFTDQFTGEIKEIEAVVSRRGMIKRQDIRDFAEAMSTAIGDSAKAAPQEVADRIRHAMHELGMSLDEAVLSVAEQYGLKGFTGAQKVTGGLLGRYGGASMLTGGIHMGVLPGEGMKGPADIEPRFQSRTDLESMRMAGFSEEMINKLVAQLHRLDEGSLELIETVRSLVDETYQADKALKQMDPRDLARLPAGNVLSGDPTVKGTLLDPDLADAFLLRLPKRGGGEENLRVPSLGTGAGMRSYFETELGAIGASEVTRQFDRLAEAAQDVQVRLKGLDVGDPESIKTAAIDTEKRMNQLISEVMGKKDTDPEGFQRAFKEFVDSFKPMVAALGPGAAGIQYRAGGQVQTRPESALGYVEAQKGEQNIMFAIRDLLTRRTGGGSKVERMGAAFDPSKVEMLVEMMDKLGVSVNVVPEAVEAAFDRLEEQKKRLKEMFADVMKGRGGTALTSRTLSEKAGGGVSVAPYAKVVSFAADVGPELAKAAELLQQLGAAGKNVGEAMSALEAVRRVQPTDVLPRDAVMINKEDFENFARELAQRNNISMDEAMKALQERSVFTHRYPTTGPASFLPSRLQQSDQVPPGVVGLGSTFAQPAGGELETALGPLRERAEELRNTIRQQKGVGDAAAQARAELMQLDSVLEGLQPVFLATQQNLDFDGDAFIMHADVVSKSAAGIETFTEVVRRGGVSLWNVLSNVINKLSGAFVGGGIAEVGADYAGLAKGREYGAQERRAMTLVPQSAAVAEMEGFTHSAPKAMVGPATDAFNKFMMSVVSGVTEIDEGFKASLGRMMLEINKALKQKHVRGKIASFELLENMVKEGGVEKILSQVGPGQMFEELGKLNMEVRKKYEEQLLKLSPEQLGVSSGADYEARIKEMVEQADLGTFLRKAQNALFTNLRTALSMEGLDPRAMESEFSKLVDPKETKEGFNKILNRVLQGIAPDYFATRAAGVKMIDELGIDDQLRAVLKMVNAVPQDVLTLMSEDITSPDPGVMREVSRKVVMGLREFFAAIQQSYQSVSPEEMQMRGGSATAGGLFRKGEISLSAERVVDPFKAALDELDKLGRGESQNIVGSLQSIITAILKFSGSLSHEGMHKALAEFPEIVTTINQAMREGTGVIGQNAIQLLEAIQNIPSIKKMRGNLYGREQALEAGRPTVLEEGQPKQVTQASVDKYREGFERAMVEEALAYTREPQKFKALFGHLPQNLQDALMAIGDEVAKRSPEIMAHSRDAAHTAIMALLEGLRLATQQGQLAPDINELRQETVSREQRLANLQIPFAGVEKLEAAKGRRAGVGELLQATTEKFGLPGLDIEEGMYKQAPSSRLPGPREPVEDIDRLRKQIESGAAFGDFGEFEKQFRAAAERWREAAGSAGIKSWVPYTNLIRELQRARVIFMANEARDLERAIDAMRAEGQTGPDLRDAVDRFDKKTADIVEYLNSITRRRGKGKGQMISITGEGGGNLLDEAVALGVKPDRKLIDAAFQRAAGRGPEADDFKPMENTLREAIKLIEGGADATKVWRLIWQQLVDAPETFKVNLLKSADAAAGLAGIMAMEYGPASKAAQGFDEITKSLKALATQARGMDIDSAEGILALGQKTATTRKLSTAGEVDFEGSIQEQRAQIERDARMRAQKYTETVQSPTYKGSSTFEPMKYRILDPDDGREIQKFEAKFVRSGGRIVQVFEQIGAASNQMNKRMGDVLRRVVQWGFATGLVYGTIRAFRSFVDTITTVQNKVIELMKVMDTSTTNFEEMQDAAVGMAKSFGVSIDQVLEGMVVYGQQGLRMSEINERTRATLAAVNVTTLSSVEATEALTSATKVYSDEFNDSMEIVDAWAAVAAKHAISAKELALAVQRAGAAASTAGVGFHDFMGIITAIGSVTRQTGKELATGAKFMFRAMRRPIATKALGDVGITGETAAGEYRPAMDILSELAGTWDKLSRAQQLNIAESLAGIRHYNQFIVLMENFSEQQLAAANSAASQGFAMRKNRVSMEAFTKQVEVLKQTVVDLALDMGKAILPTATTIVRGLSGLVEIVGSLPPAFLQIGVLGAGAFLALHKTADLATDSVGLLFGGEWQKKGLLKSVQDIGSAMKSRLVGPAQIVDGETVANAGIFVSLLDKMKAGLTKLGSLFGYGAKMGGFMFTALLALVAGFKMIHDWANRSGQEFEQSMEGVIGRSEDAAEQIRLQGQSVRSLTTIYGDFKSAVENIEDPVRLEEMLDTGTFEGAIGLAQKYQDVLLDTGLAMAQIDPSKVGGMTAAGDYLPAMAMGFDAIATSALDAQNAVTTALKTDVLERYTQDLTQARGLWNVIKETAAEGWAALTGGDARDADQSILARLEAARESVRELAAERDKLAAQGIIPIEIQEQLNSAIEKELALRQESVAIAMELKKVFDSMPIFDDLELAKQAFTPKQATAAAALAGSGQVGRGATEASVAFRQLARNVGLGGVIDSRAARSPGALSNAMLERGIRPTIGGAAFEDLEKGAIAIASEEAAKGILKLKGSLQGLSDGDAITAARSLIVNVDEALGRTTFEFYDQISSSWRSISKEELQKIAQDVEGDANQAGDAIGTAVAVFRRKAMLEAAEQTEKVLNRVSVGVMAGTAISREGMPDIGAGRRQDLSAEQRVLMAIPEPIKRLADIQARLNDLTKKYSEDILGEIEEGDTNRLQTNQEIKVATKDILLLARQLQAEAFDISVLAHYQKAIEELGITMEQASQASRDAAIAEQNRAKFVKETSGALAGKSQLPNLTFGKTFRELSAQERLSVESPGFGDFARTIASVEEGLQRRLDTLTELDKQEANSQDMIKQLEAARGEIDFTKVTDEIERQNLDISKGEHEFIKAVEKGDAAVTSLLEEQKNLQIRMAEALEASVNLQSTAGEGGSARRQIAIERARKVSGQLGGEDLRKIFGETAGTAGLLSALQKVVGIGEIERDRVGPNTSKEFVRVAGSAQVSEGARGAFNDVAQQLAEVLTEQRAMATGQGGGAAGMLARAAKLSPAGMAAGILSSKAGNTTEIKAELQTLQSKLVDELLAFPEVLELVRVEFQKSLIDQGLAKPEAVPVEDSFEKRRDEVRKLIAQKDLERAQKSATARAQVAADLKKADDILRAKEPARIAEAAQGLVQSLENMMLEFKKVEDLAFTKIDSDLEGPFGRVGKAGFKNDFELRRQEIEKEFGPISSTEKQKQLQQLEFDEKEAVIKQEQDVEIEALRRQQQAAEQMRTTLYDALSAGTLAGTGMERQVKSFVDTLTGQLATSEQAEMVGGELQFKGISALDSADSLIKRVQEFAKEKQAEAELQAAREANQPMVTAQEATTQATYKVGQDIVSAIQASTPEGTTGVRGADAMSVAAGMRAARTPDVMGPTGMGFDAMVQQLQAKQAMKYNVAPQVGATNTSLANASATAKQFGNNNLVAGVVTNAETGRVQGAGRAVDEINRGEQGSPGTSSVAEALARMEELLASFSENFKSALTDSLASLQVTVANPSLSVSVSNTADIASELSGLSVTVSNAVETTVSNLGEVVDALESAGLSALGSQVSELAGRVLQVEGHFAPGTGTVDQRIDQKLTFVRPELTKVTTEQTILKKGQTDLTRELTNIKAKVEATANAARSALGLSRRV